MKPITRELIADLKAAARIGDSDSLQIALDGLRSLTEVSGNSRLSAAFVDQVLFPLGQSLAESRLDHNLLLAVGSDPLAAVRAVSAIALATRYLTGEAIPLEDLGRPGREARSEVRTALARALAARANTRPDKLLFLVAYWTSQHQREVEGDIPGARLRGVGIQAAAGLVELRGAELLPLLAPLNTDTDPEVQVALASLLVALAEADFAPQVLELLQRWSDGDRPNTWVIAEVLSAPWAGGHRLKAAALLDALESRAGPNRHIANARKALKGI